ncbi:MAG TPA: hypothetical protein VF277_04630 [Steroidobacteraceae bacterium]
MNASMRKRLLVSAIAALLPLAMMASDDASARGVRGGGGGGRGGGFSRQGPASSGGFSQRSSPSPSTRPAEAPRSSRDSVADRGSPPPLEAARPPEGTRPPPDGSRPPDGTRPPPDGTRPPNGNRPPPPIYVPPPVYIPPPMYGGYYGGWDHYDDDWAEVAVAGAIVVGAAAAASDDDDEDDESISSSYPSVLPCQPIVHNIEGVKYYQCGTQYFVDVYGGSGPMYMPVAPPAPR